MDEEKRQAIRRHFELMFRQKAAQSVQESPDTFLAEVAACHSQPVDFELKKLAEEANQKVSLDLKRAYQKAAALWFWDRRSSTASVIVPVLICLMALGAWLRLDHIAEQSQWMDEYWAVHAATGRGNTIFNLKPGVILDPPPKSNYVEAPHWWHIWTTLSSVTHPPLYYFMLRGWIDVFGDSDLSTRWLSALFGIATIPLFFDLVRRMSGSTFQATCAAFMLTVVPCHINFSQQTRPYTIIIFFAILVAEFFFVIQAKGITRSRGIWFSVACFLLIFTHYFSAGVLVAIAIYSCFQLKSPERKWVLIGMIGAVVFFAAIWTPMFLHSLTALNDVSHAMHRAGISSEESVINLPRRLLFDDGFAHGSEAGSGFWATSAIALVTYLLPLVRLRRYPHLLLFWLWFVVVTGSIYLLDVMHHSSVTSVLRYVIVVCPAVYAIFATPFAGKLGTLFPLIFVFASAAGGFAYVQEGPMKNPDVRSLAKFIDSNVGKKDLVILGDIYDMYSQSFAYVEIGHYLHDWKSPVLLMPENPDSTLQSHIMRYPHVWLVGNATGDALAGWNQKVVFKTDVYTIRELKPLDDPKTKTKG